MWYKYIIPRRIEFLGANPFRWFNLVLLSYPKKLKWEKEKPGSHDFRALIPLTEYQYIIGPCEQTNSWFCLGPDFNAYRPSINEAAKACEQHYARKILKLQGLQ